MTHAQESRPVLVTGAGGKVGRRVVDGLRDAGRTVRAASRSTAVPLDWENASTWPAAFAGVGAAYVVPPETIVDLDPFVDVVERAGVERLVLLSARHPDQGGPSVVPPFEDAVAAADVPAVVLRPSWFVQNFTEGMFAPELAGGSLTLPVGDGAEPFIDVADIAAVAVDALLSPRHDGRVYELSGPELLTFEQAVALVGAATSRDLRFVAADPDAWAEAVGAELPPVLVEQLVRLFGAIRRGENAHLSTGVQEALGRAPRTFAQALTPTADPAGSPAPR